MRQVFRKRVLVPLQAQLTQGVTPSKLALALALGLVVGVVPVLGVTTAALRAAGGGAPAQPAGHPGGQLRRPIRLQLLLLIPAFQAGAWLFGRPPITFSLAQLQAELDADTLGTIGRYLVDNLRALAAWGLLAPVACGLLYLLLRAVLSRLPLPGADAAGRAPALAAPG